jgi:hypothetical protein
MNKTRDELRSEGTGETSHFPIIKNDTGDYTASNITRELAKRTSANYRIASVLDTFNEWSRSTGGYVKLQPEHGFVPVLIGNDGVPVALFELVEVLDEIIDYDKLKSEFPNLSYSQINGGILFLRKVAQVNAYDIDWDEIEDEMLEQEYGFLDELRNALADQETSRVLNLGE